MLTVLCILQLTPGLSRNAHFSADDVYRLKAATERQLTVPHNFVCMTNEPLDQTVETIPIEQKWPGFWCKMELFKVHGPTLYLDLDTVIAGNIDALARGVVALSDEELMMASGFWKQPDAKSSALMGWSGNKAWMTQEFGGVGQREHFYEYSIDGYGFQRGARGRQFRSCQVYTVHKINQRKQRVVFAQDFQGGMYGYLRDIKGNGGLPADASIIGFHGRPRPHQVDPVPDWLAEHYYGGVPC